MKNRYKIYLYGALFVVVAAFLAYFGIAAHYSSTHAHSSDDVSALSHFRQGMVFVLAFVATGVSLSHHRAGFFILRALVVMLSLGGIALTWLHLSQTSFWPSYVREENQYFLYIIGFSLLLVYLGLTFAFALPLISSARVFRLRFLLHFGLFPGALLIIGLPGAYHDSFVELGLGLLIGTPLILLSFRVYELQFSTNRDSQPGDGANYQKHNAKYS